MKTTWPAYISIEIKPIWTQSAEYIANLQIRWLRSMNLPLNVINEVRYNNALMKYLHHLKSERF